METRNMHQLELTRQCEIICLVLQQSHPVHRQVAALQECQTPNRRFKSKNNTLKFPYNTYNRKFLQSFVCLIPVVKWLVVKFCSGGDRLTICLYITASVPLKVWQVVLFLAHGPHYSRKSVSQFYEDPFQTIRYCIVTVNKHLQFIQLLISSYI